MIDISKKALLLFFILLLSLSLAVNGWLVYLIYQTVNVFEVQQVDTNVLSFTCMFVKKVLMAEKEIDFDTRLELETTVRGLNDQEIFDQWEKFTKAETKEEISDNAKQLLNLLVRKIGESK